MSNFVYQEHHALSYRWILFAACLDPEGRVGGGAYRLVVARPQDVLVLVRRAAGAWRGGKRWTRQD